MSVYSVPVTIGVDEKRIEEEIQNDVEHAYGYDIHGSGSNGLISKINYCPMCGKKLKGE